jgi:hypothetical protein
MDDEARQVLVEGVGDLTDAEVRRIEEGDAALVDAKLEDLEGERAWMWTVTGVTGLMTVVLPTAGLYKFFREVNNLEPIELIGVIAAACLLAAVQAIVPVVVYTGWTRRRLCLRALKALAERETGSRRDGETERRGREKGKGGDEETRTR